jgi:hypothetical protein
MAEIESYRRTARLWSVIGLCSACLLAGCGAWLAPSASNKETKPADGAVSPVRTMGENESLNSATLTSVPFYEALSATLSGRGLELGRVCDKNDPVAKRVLEDYGAIFVAGAQVTAPPVCVFTSEEQVAEFQNTARPLAQNIGGFNIELQEGAMNAFLKARIEAQTQGFDLTPRGGEAARRSFADTVRLWESRFAPALAYWQQKGRLPAAKATELRQADLQKQVAGVLELESQGLWFSKDFSKSIFYSVAAPGTSQHLSMLALDVTEFANPKARAILAGHGWFQTVQSDLPHFTYLGLSEAELPARGLVALKTGGQTFWIPNVKQ